MAVIIPQVANWSVTPQNGVEGYFGLMNIWIFESTNVISTLKSAITKMNESNSENNTINENINTKASEVSENALSALNSKNSAQTSATNAANSASSAANGATLATNEAIKAKASADSVDIIRFSEKLFDKPSRGPLFVKVSPSSIKILSGFKVSVGMVTIKLATDYTLSLNTNIDTGSKIAGTDYYVYAKSDATFYISANDAITTDRLIGGFHYGLVGESEALTGNKTEADMVKIRGINSYSFWDLKYRPVASTKGMVNIGKRWYDIYLLNSEHITNGTSKAGLFIAGGATTGGRAIPKIPLEYGGNGTINYGKFTWFQACEVAKAHNKQLISYAEFPTIAYGVLEQVSSQTNAYEKVAGKIEHYPNLTSKYGIEQATGVQWIWGSDVGGNRDEGSTIFAWRTELTDGRGDIYALHANHITAVMVGGHRDNGVDAGSRASDWDSFVWHSGWSIGCRFACDHLEFE